MLERFKMSWRFLSLSLFFWILVSSYCSGWMFFSYFCSKLLIWLLVSFPSLLVPCIFPFISLSIAFIFSSNFRPYSTSSVSILISSVLNCASDSAFFLELWSVLSFGPFFFFLSQHAHYVVRGGVLGVHQGRANQVSALWCCMWERGLRGNNASCSPLCRISVTSPATHKQMWLFSWWFQDGCTATLGYAMCLTLQFFLPVYLHTSVEPPGPPSATL